MAHPEQMFFLKTVRDFLVSYFNSKSVLEIGSLDINGSVRDFFSNCDYVGLDVGAGKHVDIVCPGEDYGAVSSAFDVVVSCEAMEHNKEWRKTWLNMLRMVKSDGLVVMTCATLGRPQHGTPEFHPSNSPLTISTGRSFYRNLHVGDFEKLTNLDEWFSSWSFEVDHMSHDLNFFGVATQAPDFLQHAANSLKSTLSQHYNNKNMYGIR